jgi:DNA-binding transcriptional LysR family regulator
VALKNLDLNLLVALEALLEERSVTEAARRIRLSQPACSAALARLRTHFGDPLLVRSGGNRYALTSLAERLLVQVGPVMEGISRITSTPAAATQETLAREYSILLADADVFAFIPSLIDSLQADAPGATLRLDHATIDRQQNMAETLRSVDGAILPHRLLEGMPYLDLYEEQWLVVADAGNPVVRDGVTPAELAALPWAAAYDRLPRLFSPLEGLRSLGHSVTVELHTESFAALPALVAGSDRVALVPARLAYQLAPATGTTAVPCPFDVHPYTLAFAWHPQFDRDPAHLWLRERIRVSSAEPPVESRVGRAATGRATRA